MGYQANLTLFLEATKQGAADPQFGQNIADACIRKSLNQSGNAPYPIYCRVGEENIQIGQVNDTHHANHQTLISTGLHPQKTCANVTILLDASHDISEDPDFSKRLLKAIDNLANLSQSDKNTYKNHTERFNAVSHRSISSPGAVHALHSGHEQLHIESYGNTASVTKRTKINAHKL